MFGRHLPLLIAAALLSHVCAAPSFAAPPQQRAEAQHAARVKADVARRGTGEKSRVTVKLRDGARLKGHVSQAGEDSFVVTDSETGRASTVAYRDVAQVKGRGGLSTAAKVGIGVGVGLAVLLVGLRAGDPILR
jgi:sRNA-binding regulator protein Hfq